MISLKEIIDIKKDILDLAHSLGLVNVRIYRNDADSALHLIVQKDSSMTIPKVFDINVDALAAMLMEKLDCQVNVKIEQPYPRFEDLLILRNNAPLNDTAKIQKLFDNIPFDKIIFGEINFEQNHQEDLEFWREIGYAFIKDRTKTKKIESNKKRLYPIFTPKTPAPKNNSLKKARYPQLEFEEPKTQEVIVISDEELSPELLLRRTIPGKGAKK